VKSSKPLAKLLLLALKHCKENLNNVFENYVFQTVLFIWPNWPPNKYKGGFIIVPKEAKRGVSQPPKYVLVRPGNLKAFNWD